LLRGGQGLPSTSSFVVAFCSSFLFFLQLRIADEFKDHEEDTLYRPYRPVPRGLVTLNELRVLGIGAAVVQAALALWLQPALLLLLAVVWLYLALMSCEFFARDWLKARPFTYMWTAHAHHAAIDGLRHSVRMASAQQRAATRSRAVSAGEFLQRHRAGNRT
jgi:4-hydroxybenzoate polyprenyltransferase